MFKVEIRQDCKICGGALPNSRFRTFCSKACRDKHHNNTPQRRQYGQIYQQRRADELHSVKDDSKVKCEICGRYYVQVGSHIVQRHGITARQYREEYELEVKRGTVPDWYRKLKGEHAIENGTVDNLKAGAKHRFKPGDKVGTYQRSPVTLERLRHLKQNFINTKRAKTCAN